MSTIAVLHANLTRPGAARSAVAAVWWVLLLAIIGLGSLMAMGGAFAGTQPDESSDREARLRAEFVTKFIKFTKWPAGTFASETASLEIGIIGGTPDERRALRGIFEARTKGLRKLAVRDIDRLPDDPDQQEARDAVIDSLRRCHVLVVCKSERRRFKPVLQQVREMDLKVLTVSTIDQFAASGGMIELFLSGDNYQFKLNRDAVTATTLDMDPRLMNLAAKIISSASQ